MSKNISITDKLDNSKPSIEINGKDYIVDNSVSSVLKFEELSQAGTSESLMEAIKIALGKTTFDKLNVNAWSFQNFRVLVTAIFAVMTNTDYAEVDNRFQK